MARPSGLKRPCPSSRDSARAAARGWNWRSHSPVATVTMPVAADELYSFSLSRVSHKGEFYLERFLMRQHCTTAPFEV